MDRAARAIIRVVLLTVPVAVLYRLTWDAFNLPKLVILLVGVSLAAGCILLRPGAIRGCRAVAVPVLALLLPLFVGWLASPYKVWALAGQYTFWSGLVPLTVTTLLALVVAVAFRGSRELLMWPLLLSSACAGAYAIVQVLGWEMLDWGIYGRLVRGGSFFGNPNYSGGFLVLCLPLAIAAWRLQPARRPWLAPVCLLILGGVVLARSEVSWVAAFGGVVVTISLMSRASKVRAIGGLIALGCAAALVGGVTLAMTEPAIGGRLPYVRDRGFYWIGAAGMGLASPVVGRGPGVFALEGTRYRAIEEGARMGFSFTVDPHSLPMTLFANEGLVGLAGFIVLLLWLFRRARETEPGDCLSAGFVGVAVTFLVQSLAATDQIPQRMMLSVAIGGLAAGAMGQRSEEAEGRPSRPSLVRLATVVFLTLAALAVSGGVLASDRAAFAAEQAARRGDAALAVKHQVAAASLWNAAHHRSRLGSHLGQLLLGGDRIEQEDLAAVRQAYSYLEDIPDVDSLARFAEILYQASFSSAEPEALLDEASGVNERALSLDPVNPLLRVQAADILIAQGDPDAAHDILIVMFFYLPDQSQYWGALALANAQVGDEDVALSYMAAAFERNPRDARALRAREILEASDTDTSPK